MAAKARADEVCDPTQPANDLAHMYYCRGEYHLAAEQFRRYCSRGSVKGCASLGFMYEQGKGVPVNRRAPPSSTSFL